MNVFAEAMKDCTIPVRKLSRSEARSLALQYPEQRKVTVRVPSKRGETVLIVGRVYSPSHVQDTNGEPWHVAPDSSGRATYVAI